MKFDHFTRVEISEIRFYIFVENEVWNKNRGFRGTFRGYDHHVWVIYSLGVMRKLVTNSAKLNFNYFVRLDPWFFEFGLCNPFHDIDLFHTPWKFQKTSGPLMFSGGIEREQWHELGQFEFNFLSANPAKVWLIVLWGWCFKG